MSDPAPDDGLSEGSGDGCRADFRDGAVATVFDSNHFKRVFSYYLCPMSGGRFKPVTTSSNNPNPTFIPVVH